MSTRLKTLAVILIPFLILLAACSPNANASPAGDDLGEDIEVTGPMATQAAEDGSATVYYNYWMNNPILEFKIQPVFPVHIVEGEPGTFRVSGITEKAVSFRMAAAGGPTGSCQIRCNVNLRFAAEGEIQLDPKTGECTIPMSFQFQPQQDEWILETDCPEESKAVIDCAALTLTMVDPTIYTFSKNERGPNYSQDASVTLKAEIRDIVWPRNVGNLCAW
jgi:hypothetical protein